jgi:hypothetical protein
MPFKNELTISYKMKCKACVDELVQKYFKALINDIWIGIIQLWKLKITCTAVAGHKENVAWDLAVHVD